MNGAESVLRTLAASGVDVCFANPGTSEMHLVAAMDRVPEVRGVLTLFEGVASAAADGYAWEKASAGAETARQRLQEEVRGWVIDRKLGQARLARSLSSLSPALLIQDLGERLTGSGGWRDRAFLAQARGFRSVLEGRVRRLDLADPASPHIFFFRGYLSRRPVPPGAVPPFTFREIPVTQGFANAAPALALLTLETLLLAGLLFARKERE